jgi:hypothetical protein
MMATVLSGFWSLMSGHVFPDDAAVPRRAGLRGLPGLPALIRASGCAKVFRATETFCYGDLRTRRAGA